MTAVTTSTAAPGMHAKEAAMAAEQHENQVTRQSSMCIIALLERWLQSPMGATRCDQAGFVPLRDILACCPSLCALTRGSAAALTAAVASSPATCALELDAGHVAVRFRGLLERVRVAAEQHVAAVGAVSLDSLMQAGPVVAVLSGVPEASEQLEVLKDAVHSSHAVQGQWVMPTDPLMLPASPMSADAPVFRPSWQSVETTELLQGVNVKEVDDESHAKPRLIKAELKVDVDVKVAKCSKTGSTSPSASDYDGTSHTPLRSMMAEPDSEPEVEASPRKDTLLETPLSRNETGSMEASAQLRVKESQTERVATSLKTAPAHDQDDNAATLETTTSGGAKAAVHEEAQAVLEPQEAATKTVPPTPTSWAAQQRMSRVAAGKTKDQEVARAIKATLNKLTIEKFAQLSQQLLAIEFQTKGHVELLIQEVFEKATMQHHFIDMYADLCIVLHEFFTGHAISEDPKFTFKRVLLNQCQAAFERNLVPPAGLADLDPEDRVIQETRYKMRMVGNIQLVGALLTRHLIPTKVMFAIFDELLSSPTPEALEAAAVLMTAVGSTFDSSESGLRPVFTGLFLRMKDLAASGTCEPRARCLLKDVLELRAGGWQIRRPKRQELPTTLKAVATRVAAEASIMAAGTSAQTRA